MAAARPDGGARPTLRTAIGIPTRGRAPILRETLREVRRQRMPPDRVIVCHTGSDDVEGLDAADDIELIRRAPSSTGQRNAILDAAADCDLVLFIDDDFLLSPRYLEVTAEVFLQDETVVASTGIPVADGVKGPGITVEDARAMIAADHAERDASAPSEVMPAPHAYGCNMAVRIATLHANGIRFDERLPLYGWSEDMDFSYRLRRHGRIVKLARARGVHLGTKHWRSPGRKFGYSQVANPIYLWRKGSYSFGRAARSVGRNLAANTAKALWPEPWIDRRGRLVGNVIAFQDLLRGRLAPERVLEL